MSTPIKVESFPTLEQDFGTTIAEGLWKKVIQTVNYIEKSSPIGMLMFVHETQDLLPHAPDSKYWKLCDGTSVSNGNSPLNGHVLPDFRDKFFRHPSTGETVLSIGGSDTVNLSHSHGGVTGSAFPRLNNDLDNGSERAEITNHSHTISTTSLTVSTVPLYIALKVYVRIV